MRILVIAQVSPAEDVACADVEAQLLCRLVFRWTGNDLAATAASYLGVALRVVVMVVIAIVLARLARATINRFARTMERRIEARLNREEAQGTLVAARYRSRRLQRLQATTGVVGGAVGVVIWAVVVVAVLEAVGVPLQPILAGAGLAGIVLGFGAQQLVRDVLAGFAMLVEDQFGVGDWIEVEGVIGQVERVGMRATSFRDLNGILHHVLNGSLQRVGNLSQEWSRSLLDVPLALDADVPTAKALIHKVASDLAADPVWSQDIIGEPQIWGVQDFGPDGLSIRLVMPTKPMANWDINRQLRERLHHAFDRAGIRIQGRLVELGGMRTGYPVMTRVEESAGPAPRRRRGLVPHDIGPLDQPPAPRQEVVPEPREEPREEPAEPPRDHTAELRLERGREPRPD